MFDIQAIATPAVHGHAYVYGISTRMSVPALKQGSSRGRFSLVVRHSCTHRTTAPCRPWPSAPEWIADQDEEMSRPEAIRRLLDAALEAGEVEATLLRQVRALARDLAREKGGK
jgi:hypothetical protein